MAKLVDRGIAATKPGQRRQLGDRRWLQTLEVTQQGDTGGRQPGNHLPVKLFMVDKQGKDIVSVGNHRRSMALFLVSQAANRTDVGQQKAHEFHPRFPSPCPPRADCPHPARV